MNAKQQDKAQNEPSIDTFKNTVQLHLDAGVDQKELKRVFNELVGNTSSRAIGDEQIKLEIDPGEIESAKLPEQAKGILRCIHGFGDVTTKTALIEDLLSHISTQQAPGRIYQFYRKRLVEEGFISTGPVPTASKKESEEKPKGGGEAKGGKDKAAAEIPF